MKSNFDNVWEKRRVVETNSSCGISDEKLEKMIVRAMVQAPTVRQIPTSPLLKRRYWILSGAAAIAAVIVSLSLFRTHNSLPTVEYNGQEVQFICNHECDANDILEAFQERISEP